MAISPLPTPPSRNDPANFAERGDAFLAALPQFVTEANALQQDVNDKQASAVQAAAAATAKASDASQGAQAAIDAATAAGGSAQQADSSRSLAADWASKVGAAVVAGLYSAREWAIGTFTRGQAGGGSAKDWATYTGGKVDDAEYSAKKYAGDAAAKADAAAASANDAAATAASFNDANLVHKTGAETINGPKTFANAINEAAPVVLASAATVNIGAAASNNITITGTADISAFDAVAAGAIRRLTMGASVRFINSANIVMPGGMNFYAQSGDVLTFRSKGGGAWELIGAFRQRSLVRVVAYMTAVTPMPSPLTYYPIRFNEVYIDRLTEHSKATYTTTIKEAGDYDIFAQAMFSLGNTGDWAELAIHINGTRKSRGRSSVSDAATAWLSVSVFDSFNLAAGDTIQIYGQYNSSNTDRNIQTTGDKELTRLIIKKAA